MDLLPGFFSSPFFRATPQDGPLPPRQEPPPLPDDGGSLREVAGLGRGGLVPGLMIIYMCGLLC